MTAFRTSILRHAAPLIPTHSLDLLPPGANLSVVKLEDYHPPSSSSRPPSPPLNPSSALVPTPATAAVSPSEGGRSVVAMPSALPSPSSLLLSAVSSSSASASSVSPSSAANLAVSGANPSVAVPACDHAAPMPAVAVAVSGEARRDGRPGW